MLFFYLLLGCQSTDEKDFVFSEEPITEQDIDADLDGYLRSEDCDDASPSINPGAIEVCDGRDNDCNGEIDEGVQITFYLDNDGDGYGDTEQSIADCEPPENYVVTGNDCDDNDDSLFPGAVENCDGMDNNCDGQIDENLGDTFYLDADEDGFGNATETIQSCTQPQGYIPQSGDCDDSNAGIFPGAAENCDGIDNNCNGDIDEGGTLTWYLDADGDGYGSIEQPTQSCAQPVGYVDNASDCDDSTIDISPDATEICDYIDNDCNGVSDDNALDAITWYQDADLDGFGISTVTVEACTQPVGYANNANDCDDTRFESSPISLEYCNGFDDNCDGNTDEADAVDATIYFVDSDGDGYGDPYSPTASCSQLTGYVTNNQDCNDNEGSIYPYATEYCNEVDDNCNTLIDEVAVDQTLFYQDADGDGYGGIIFELACEASTGFVSLDGDCDDNNPNVSPSETEACNEVDDDCNGDIDDGIATSLWYLDSDGDGYGDPNQPTYNCLQPSGYIAQGDDCNDTDSSINPSGTEVCNGVDDDCDGSSDAGSLGGDELCVADSCLDILTAHPNSQDALYYISFDSGIEQTECDMGSFGGGWTRVFADNMSPPDTGWTLQTTSICGIWGEILGGYNVISGGEFNNTISTRSIPHTELWVEMDYITLDSWDDTNDIQYGPDEAYVLFNGTTSSDYIWFTDIDNHLSLYGQVCGWGSLEVVNNCPVPNLYNGVFCTDDPVDGNGNHYTHDSRHYVSTIESGYFDTFTLYVGSTLSQAPYDESFGLDDVYVWVR